MAETTIFDTEDEFAWSSIYTRTDNQTGLLVRRETVYDNGVTLNEFFQDGVASSSAKTDGFPLSSFPPYPIGTKDWTRIFTDFDDFGVIEYRTTDYDNGVSKFESFENGERRAVLKTDGYRFGQEEPDDPGAKPWTSIATIFDEEGLIENYVIYYDNGIILEQDYSNGILSRTYASDNWSPRSVSLTGPSTQPWLEKSAFYDDDGVLESRETIFDNGVRKYEEFTNGILSQITKNEGWYPSHLPPGQTDEKSWDKISTVFDENGLIEERKVNYKNEIQKTETFADGARVTTLKEDGVDSNGSNVEGNGVKEWQEIFTTFEAGGETETRAVIYDTGDEKHEDFVDGDLIARALYDGDNSEDWLGRVTTFDAQGDVATDEFYYSEQELPPEYFDTLAG